MMIDQPGAEMSIVWCLLFFSHWELTQLCSLPFGVQVTASHTYTRTDSQAPTHTSTQLDVHRNMPRNTLLHVEWGSETPGAAYCHQENLHHEATLVEKKNQFDPGATLLSSITHLFRAQVKPLLSCSLKCSLPQNLITALVPFLSSWFPRVQALT